MTERRESEEISRAARRMAEAAEEISRSVARLAEHEAATEQAYRVWENFVHTLEEIRSTGSGDRGGSFHFSQRYPRRMLHS